MQVLYSGMTDHVADYIKDGMSMHESADSGCSDSKEKDGDSVPLSVDHDRDSVPLSVDHDGDSVPLSVDHDGDSVPLSVDHGGDSVPLSVDHDYFSSKDEKVTKDSSNVQDDSEEETLKFDGLDSEIIDPETNSKLLESMKDSVDSNKDPETGEKATEENEWIDILGSGDLKKLVINQGKESSRPQRGDRVDVYVETKVQDESIKEEDVTFTLGDGEVMQGLELVIATMNDGETAQVYVAPRFGWGTLGFENIPPNSSLNLTVTLKSHQTEPDIESLSTAQKLEIGQKKKHSGNFWYGRNEYPQAVQCYRKALDYLDDTSDPSEVLTDDVKELLDFRLKVYNNMAAAQMKLKAFSAAMRSVDNVLLCQQTNLKALYRKAKILSEIGRTQEAIMVLRKAEKVDPEEKTVQVEINRLTNKLARENQKERSVYKRMFRGFNESPKMSQNAKWDWTILGWVIGGAAVAALGAIAYRFKVF